MYSVPDTWFMYCDTWVHVLPGRYTGPCIAGSIHGPMYCRARYMADAHGGFFVCIGLLCVYLGGLFAPTPIYVNAIHASDRIHKNTAKRKHQNTFGGIRTPDLGGGIATIPVGPFSALGGDWTLNFWLGPRSPLQVRGGWTLGSSESPGSPPREGGLGPWTSQKPG